MQILESAVNDACEKVEVIARALGHKLSCITSVEYSKRRLEIDASEHEYYCENAEMSEKSSIDYTPEDFEADDTVGTVWYLK